VYRFRFVLIPKIGEYRKEEIKRFIEGVYKVRRNLDNAKME